MDTWLVPAEPNVVRRVRLPADRRTPAAARAVVRSALEEARLADVLDEALLLTTELSTNAVVHAGTDLELEVVADASGLTVTVMDFAGGTVAAGSKAVAVVEELRHSHGTRPPLSELSERGRGLLLVDHFASRWGTTHHGAGKGVWFRLDHPIANVSTAGGRAETGAGTGALAALLVSPDPYADDMVTDFANTALARLADLVGAAGAVVRYNRGEGGGAEILARYGRAPRRDSPTVRVPLPLGRPASGELELDAPASEYVRSLASLVVERLTLVLENERLRRVDQRRQTWLTFLAEASELLAQSLDVDLTLALIPLLVVPRLGQWAAVHTADDWGRLSLRAATHADESALPQLYASLGETGPESVQDRLPDALRVGGQVLLPPPTEGFAVPLIARGQALGTLSVGRPASHRHDPDEIAVLEDVARRSALAIDNALIHAERREVAQTLQRSLLPPKLPVVRGIGFGAVYVPTGDTVEVGGDFYDVVSLRDDRWLVVIGDVSGKGVHAATVTGLVREVIRAMARVGRPLPEVLERLNETLGERGGGHYCTLALALVAPVRAEADDGTHRLDVTLHLAGHDRPVLLRADGDTSSVGTGGTALGLLDTIAYPAETVRLEVGDSLIFYTDGVTERRRGRELFGVRRLREAAAPLGRYSAEVIAARLRTTALGFSMEDPRDDIALLVLRNEPS